MELRDFVLGGVSLEGEAKDRYNAIQQELAQLSTKFSNNVLDATKVRCCDYSLLSLLGLRCCLWCVVCVCVCVAEGGSGEGDAPGRARGGGGGVQA